MPLATSEYLQESTHYQRCQANEMRWKQTRCQGCCRWPPLKG
jgi:hypothetical protein